MKTTVGKKTFIDRDTGEIIETQTVLKYGDFDFDKLWLAHILDAVEQVGNKKMQVLMWLIKNRDSDNRIFATFKQICDACGCHVHTLRGLIKALEETNVITRPARGQLRINPSVIFKGGHSKRMNVLIKYRDEKQADLFENIESKSNKEAA